MTSQSTRDLPPAALRPTHVAIIMDGNGRWAADQGLPRLAGHRRGATVVREITTFCRELGITYLTLYSFSTENWRRPVGEVTGLMQLLEDFCRDERDQLIKHNMRLQVIGNTTRLPSTTQAALHSVCMETAHHTSMTLSLAIDYGGREEITKAVRSMVTDVQNHVLDEDNIEESTIARYLDTRGMPDPDLMIRTSGELRISNFLLWQMAYTELYFTDVRWPEFTRVHFTQALHEYARRQRRFGATGEQIADHPRHS